MEVDIGAFDLSTRVAAKVDWLEESNDFAVLNLRHQFQRNLDLLAGQYQAYFSRAMALTIKKKQMYFEIPDLNLENMTDAERDSLKDLG
jgi:hypothetical protein